jgi:alpha-glucosidase
MTGWEARDLTVDLSFLGDQKYTAFIWEDGINAGRDAEDFKAYEKNVAGSDTLTIRLAPGGGWAARLVPVE